MFEVGWGDQDELGFFGAEDDGEGFFGAGAVDEVDFALAAQDAFVVEFYGVDGLVLVGDGDFAFGYEVAEEGDDLVFVDPGDVEAVIEVDEFFEQARVGLDGVGAVAHFLEFFDEVVGARSVIWNIVWCYAGGFVFVCSFFFILEIKVLINGSSFDLKLNGFAERDGPPFVFGVPAGVRDGFKDGSDEYVVGEKHTQAVISGFDDQEGFFLEDAVAGGGVCEIVGGLLNNRVHAGTEIFDDNVEVAFVMGYNPGSYASIPNGKTKRKNELDVGVILGHAKDEATGGNF